jgi:hypothetical protein
MRRSLSILLIVMLSLSGCAKIAASKFNPLNWFGPARPAATMTLYVPPAENRLLVAQVLTMKVERNANGAIVRATGLPTSQGWWEAELVTLAQDDPTKIVLEFRLYPPVVPAPAGTQASREVTVALALSTVKLDGVRSIEVRGETNALTSKR